MKNIIIIPLIFAALAFACKDPGNSSETNLNNTNANSLNTNSNQTKKPANNSIPPTTETSSDGNDFVPSETGEEKAKPEAGKANIQGKVLFNSQPVPNIDVKLCEKLDTIVYVACTGKSFATKTDANGEYVLANVPAMVYGGMTVRVFSSKMFVFATSGFGGLSAAKYKLEADKTFFAPPTNLFKWDIKVQNPKLNAKVAAADFEAKWDAYADAAYYKISLLPKDYTSETMNSLVTYSDEKVETNSFKPDKTLSNGKYSLRIKAYNADDVKIAETEKDIDFTVNDDSVGGGGKAANSK